MARMGKCLTLCLVVILAASTLLMIKLSDAQSIPKPSVPQFTLQLVGPPFKQNTTYSLNPNTGEIEPNIGYTNSYSYLVIIIKNQHFDQNYSSIYYNITVDGNPVRWEDNQYPEQTSDSDSTNITLSIFGGWGYDSLIGRQVSIQVQTLLGGLSYTGHNTPPFQSYYDFTGQTSDWGNTQTIAVPANVPLGSNSPNPTPTPLVPEFPITLSVITFLVAVSLSLILGKRKRARV